MFKKLLQVSRPRFWMYAIGPYLIGVTCAQDFNTASALNHNIFWWLLYFTLPANLFIYGVNDIADTDTDAFNSKKGSYEAKVAADEKKSIALWSVLLALPFVYVLWTSSLAEQLCFVIFVFFGLIYSLPPLRLKARPFIDSLSNGVGYTMPGLMGYFAAGGKHIAWVPYLVAFLWASVMHAYSAIPDIEADGKAGIKTIATVLGKEGTLWLCGGLYILMGVLLALVGYPYQGLLAIPYVLLIALSFNKLKVSKSVFGVYKMYPYVTYVVGALISFLTVNLR